MRGRYNVLIQKQYLAFISGDRKTASSTTTHSNSPLPSVYRPREMGTVNHYIQHLREFLGHDRGFDMLGNKFTKDEMFIK